MALEPRLASTRVIMRHLNWPHVPTNQWESGLVGMSTNRHATLAECRIDCRLFTPHRAADGVIESIRGIGGGERGQWWCIAKLIYSRLRYIGGLTKLNCRNVSLWHKIFRFGTRGRGCLMTLEPNAVSCGRHNYLRYIAMCRFVGPNRGRRLHLSPRNSISSLSLIYWFSQRGSCSVFGIDW